MKTKLIEINPEHISSEKILIAANIIKRGGLVAFPTETVYGIGANALDKYAISKIYLAKNRPSDNPLIVHVDTINSVTQLVKEIPEYSKMLMEIFWPGPLTIIMKRNSSIPSEVSAGLDTIAVRMPLHQVALELIKSSGCPIAAPSANISGRPSPTIAEHVIQDLSGKVDAIIDSGIVQVGIESTVLDMTSSIPAILRPGAITKSQLESVIGPVNYCDEIDLHSRDNNSTPRCPGVKYTHYSPNAKVILVEGELSKVVQKINELVDKFTQEGLVVGVLATEQTKLFYQSPIIISAGTRDDFSTIAANLFDTLRKFDAQGADIILSESTAREEIGLAIMNRLSKAAGYNIIRA